MSDTPTSRAAHNQMAAIDGALASLVADGTLSEQQAQTVALRLRSSDGGTGPAAPTASSTLAADHGRGRLAEIAGYAGGALLVGALVLTFINSWGGLSPRVQVGFLYASAVILGLGGLAVGTVGRTRGRDLGDLGEEETSARRRLVSVLWTFAAFAAAWGTGLIVEDPSWGSFVSGCAVGLALATAAYVVVPSAVGQAGMGALAVGLVCAVIGLIDEHASVLAYALSLMALAGLWAVLASIGVLRERESGLTIATVLAVVSAQLPLFDGDEGSSVWLGANDLTTYVLTALVAYAGFAVFLRSRSWPVLGGAVVATTLVVPELLYDATDGSMSAAVTLLVAGVALLAASAAGLRLRSVR